MKIRSGEVILAWGVPQLDQCLGNEIRGWPKKLVMVGPFNYSSESSGPFYADAGRPHVIHAKDGETHC